MIDATCPLVTKVHLEAIRYAREGYSIILVGHADHDEVVGTMGEAPDRMFVIAHPDEVERLVVPDPDKVAFLTQTTLSVDDTRDCIAALRRRFPKIVGPSKDDICYATQNRQAAAKTVAAASTCCWSSAPPTARTPTAWSRCPRGSAPRPTSSTTRTTSGPSGSRARRASA